MAVPDFQSLMKPILELVPENEVRARDLVGLVADKLSLSDADRAELLPSGHQKRLENRVYWSVIYLARAGLLERTRRGYFKISDRGKRALDENPARIDIRYLSKYPEFAEFRARQPEIAEAGQAEPSLANTPDEAIRTAHKSIDAALSAELVARVQTAPPGFFERVIVELLLAMGYGGSTDDAGRTLGGSGLTLYR